MTRNFRAPLVLPVLAGVLLLVIFLVRYGSMNPDWYEARDDGVITMSHAKNLVDWGTIGVSPSGERVEGFSTPVEFAAFGAAYALLGVQYDSYSRAQTVVCSFLVGLLFSLFFRERLGLGLIATTITALFLSYCYAFFLWHGSGMENPITHVTFLWAFLLLTRALERAEAPAWLAIPVFIASVSRIESIYYIGPMIFLFALIWWLSLRDTRGVRPFVIFLGLWGAFQALRYAYFGNLVPNTGYAQSIDLGTRIAKLVSLDAEIWSTSFHFASMILKEHSAYVFFAVIPLLFFARRSRELYFVVLVVAMMLALSFASPFLFGRARLNVARTTTHLPIFIMLGAFFILKELRDRRVLLVALPLITLLAFTELRVHGNKPGYLCCSVDRLSAYNEKLKELKRENELFRPTVAIAALGLISFEKNFNILDMGYLGSPVVARFKHDNDPAIREYFLDYVAPDFVELHDTWSCEHHGILGDPRFRRRYRPVVKPVRTQWLRNQCAMWPEAVTGYWVRKDVERGAGTRERLLIDTLAEELSVDRIMAEIDVCRALEGPRACMYVVRTVYRFLPEFDRAGHLEVIRERLAGTPVRRYSNALLESRDRGSWYLDIVALLEESTARGGRLPR